MVFEKIRGIICEGLNIPESEVTLETKIIDDLNADSLDIVELAMSIEDVFGLGEMSEQDMKKIQTVEDLVNYVTAAID